MISNRLLLLIAVIFGSILFCFCCSMCQADSSPTAGSSNGVEEEPSEFGAYVAVVMLFALIGAIFGSRFWGIVFVIGCLIELIFGWEYIIVVLVLDLVILPMGAVAFGSSLFNQK